jgi:hypothetical protein
MSGLGVRLLCASPEGAEVERRFAEWVARWPTKVLARRFDASPRTVKAWRAGQMPQSTTFTAMVQVWGIAFLEHIFAPVLAPSDLDVARRLDRLQSDLSALKEALHDHPGEAAGQSPGAAVPASGRVLPRLRGALPCLVAAALALTAALQQVAPAGPGADMARVRPVAARVVRVVAGGGRDVLA